LAVGAELIASPLEFAACATLSVVQSFVRENVVYGSSQLSDHWALADLREGVGELVVVPLLVRAIGIERLSRSS
jgi:hypothetical protein